MTSQRLLPALGLVAAAVVLVSGCTPEPEPSPTRTALFASEKEAFAAAEETYREYIAAVDEVQFNDPTTFESALKFSADELNAADREFFSEMHAAGYTQSGTTTVVSFEALAYDPEAEQLTARSCINQSEVQVLDSSGVSVVPTERPDEYQMSLLFVGGDGDLLLARSQPVEGSSC